MAPGSNQLSESRFVSEDQDASGSEWPTWLLNDMTMGGGTSGFMVPLQPGSVLMSDAPVTIEGYATPEVKNPVGVLESYCLWGRW